MKIFVSYRFSGEDQAELKKNMEGICQSLSNAGFDNSCSFFNEQMFQANKYSVQQIMEHSLKELDQCDALLAFVNSDQKSEGMLIEVGYAVAKNKPIILAKRKGINTHSLDGVATKVIEFEDLEQLGNSLKELSI
jgi:nucleoside 2-deoxyribosyltransferase